VSNLARRDNQLNTTSSSNALQPAATYTVYVLEPGAVVQAIASASNTVRVYKGHGLAAADKFLVGASTSQFCTIAAGGVDTAQAGYDTITLEGSTEVTAAVGDVLINLGQDGGSASPSYDAAAVAIYNDPAGATTAITQSAVTTNSVGNYGYWVAAGEVWELIVADATPDSYITGIYPYVRRTIGAASETVVTESVVTGDTYARHSVDVGGIHSWGSGSAATDTTLYRSAADTLKTDDALIVTGASTLTGAVAAGAGIAVTGAITGSTTLTVDGASTLTGAVAAGAGIAVTGAATVSTTLTVDGASTLTGAVSAGASIAATGAISCTNITTTGYAHKSLTTGITAGSTQTQAGATALTTEVNVVTVVGTTGDGVKLPEAAAGRMCRIKNNDSTEGVAVWPATDDSIDSAAVDAVDPGGNVTAGNSRLYIAEDAINWIAVG